MTITRPDNGRLERDAAIPRGNAILAAAITIFPIEKNKTAAERCDPSVERVMRIEPTHPAWKAGVLPLNYTRAIKLEGSGRGDRI